MKTLLKILNIPYWYLLFGPSLMLAAGFAMNEIVMAFNNGQMPVLAPGGCPKDGLESWIHVCMTPATHLKFLADWIVLHNGIASPGDFLIWGWDAIFWPALAVWVALTIKDLK